MSRQNVKDKTWNAIWKCQGPCGKWHSSSDDIYLVMMVAGFQPSPGGVMGQQVIASIDRECFENMKLEETRPASANIVIPNGPVTLPKEPHA